MTKRLLLAPCLLASVLAITLLFIGGANETGRKNDAASLMPDSPIAAAQFRYQQRLSEDGKIPDGAFAKAMQQRNAILDAQGGQIQDNPSGPYPGGWTWLGPGNIGGRVREILIDPTNPNTMWTGGASGGVWKTTNGGASWAPMDDFMPTLAIGCMALDKTNPSVLYVGTGEGFFETIEGTSNTAAVRGAGIFKSVDGGTTWNHMSSTSGPEWYFVNRIAISPANSQHMLVATNSGLYRTLDGGASWALVYDEHIYDVRFHPTDASRAVAGLHDHGAIYSVDGGATWNAATGLTAHRTELCYAPGSPSTIYAALSDSDQIRIYRSTDGGVSYALRTSGSGIGTYSAYNNTLWVDPTNSNRIIFGGVNLYRSTDGGVTRTQVFTAVHSDMHAIITHPGYNGTTNRTVFFGTDGGVYRTTDSTGTAATGLNNNLGITQWYGAVMNPLSGRILAGAQDNGTKLYTGNPQAWTTTFGGDGGYCATDPTNANYFYGEVQWANVFRSTNGGVSASYIFNGPNPIVGAGTTQFNFIPYLMLDPNDPNRMYVGGRLLWRSNNVKGSQVDWFSIKPSIEPPGRAGPGSGGAHFAPNPPWNISTIAVANGNSNLIYVGYNNGQIWKTDNGLNSSPTWLRIDDVTGPMPERWISKIIIDPTNPNRIYVAFMGWEPDNIWFSGNSGGTWTAKSGLGLFKLPSVPVSAFNVHPSNAGWLYAGTDLGLFFSADDGATWTTSNSGPGIVPIEELHWVNGSLVAVTHGRGVYQTAVSSTSILFSPELMEIVSGKHSGGRLQELYASDDRWVRLAVKPSNNGIIHLTGTSPIASPSKLVVTVEGSTTSTSSDPLFFYLWNPAGGWEEVNITRLSMQDSVSRRELTGTQASRYVDPITHQLKLRLLWMPSGLTSSTFSCDQVLFEVEP